MTSLSVDRERAQALETTHAPAYQETSYRCAGLLIRKRAFLPVRDDLLQIFHLVLTMENTTDSALQATIVCDAHFPAFVWPGMYKVPEMSQRNKRVTHREEGDLLISATVGQASEVRVFGADAEIVSTNLSDRGFSRSLRAEVAARSSREVNVSMAVSHRGENDACNRFAMISVLAVMTRLPTVSNRVRSGRTT